jgi:hypothetical protein
MRRQRRLSLNAKQASHLPPWPMAVYYKIQRVFESQFGTVLERLLIARHAVSCDGARMLPGGASTGRPLRKLRG